MHESKILRKNRKKIVRGLVDAAGTAIRANDGQIFIASIRDVEYPPHTTIPGAVIKINALLCY